MKNEILEELWKVKDQVAHEYGYNVEKLADELQKKERDEKTSVVDLTLQSKSVVTKS